MRISIDSEILLLRSTTLFMVSASGFTVRCRKNFMLLPLEKNFTIAWKKCNATLING
jgi:hypothetical protein